MAVEDFIAARAARQPQEKPEDARQKKADDTAQQTAQGVQALVQAQLLESANEQQKTLLELRGDVADQTKAMAELIASQNRADMERVSTILADLVVGVAQIAPAVGQWIEQKHGEQVACVDGLRAEINALRQEAAAMRVESVACAQQTQQAIARLIAIMEAPIDLLTNKAGRPTGAQRRIATKVTK